jgi:hypothetical protein
MMVEIEKNGPIVVSFEPDEGFMNYRQGIYAKGDFSGWYYQNQEQPEWYKVDHSGNNSNNFIIFPFISFYFYYFVLFPLCNVECCASDGESRTG